MKRRMNWLPAPQRNGTTLIEMASVMMLVGMLLLLSVKALTAAGRLQTSSTIAMADIKSWQQIEGRLRNDLARARSAAIDSDQQFTLELDTNRFLRFRVFDSKTIAREVVEMDEANQPKIVGHDALIFSSPFKLRLELLSSDLLRLSFDADEPHQIVSLLGRARRFDPMGQQE